MIVDIDVYFMQKEKKTCLPLLLFKTKILYAHLEINNTALILTLIPMPLQNPNLQPHIRRHLEELLGEGGLHRPGAKRGCTAVCGW